MSGILIYAVAILVGVLVLIGLGVFCTRTFVLRSTLEESEKAWERERSLRQQGENYLQGERVRLRDELEQLGADYLEQGRVAQRGYDNQRKDMALLQKDIETLEESLDGSLDESPSEFSEVFGGALTKIEKKKKEERKTQRFLDIFYESSDPDYFKGFDEERLLRTAASLGCPISKEDAQRICRDTQWEGRQLDRLHSGIVFRCRQMGEPYYIGTNGSYALKVTTPDMPEAYVQALVYEIFGNVPHLGREGTTEEELRRLRLEARKAIDKLEGRGLEFPGTTIEFAEGQVSVAGQLEFPEWKAASWTSQGQEELEEAAEEDNSPSIISDTFYYRKDRNEANHVDGIRRLEYGEIRVEFPDMENEETWPVTKSCQVSEQVARALLADSPHWSERGPYTDGGERGLFPGCSVRLDNVWLHRKDGGDYPYELLTSNPHKEDS